MDNLLLWLFLNGRTTEEETYLGSLANNSLQTPATYLAKQITVRIKDILSCVGDSIQNSEAIKISLHSLVSIVRSMNKTVLQNATDESMGFDSALRLCRRSNSLFTSLLESWLVSDTTINYFCFDLCGFAFLLDTVGSDEPLKSSTTEETKEGLNRVEQKLTSAMANSDLDDLLSDSSGSQDFAKNLLVLVKAKEHPDWEVLGILQSLKKKIDIPEDPEEDAKEDEEKKEGEVGSQEPFYTLPIVELGKNMVL
jgi:hypothetical protein